MDESLQARDAALEAVADITPQALHAVIDDHITQASMIPGVLTILSARVMDDTADPDAVHTRAAGVQLIYEGLRVTRDLVTCEPWRDNSEPDTDDDLDILAADVMVSRGFRILARTEAADRAVETVREFGREQTDSVDTTPVRSLEANVFELAAIAGATATGKDTPLALRQYVVGLARSRGEPPLPTATDGLPETIEEVMTRVSEPQDGRVRTSSAGDH